MFFRHLRPTGCAEPGDPSIQDIPNPWAEVAGGSESHMRRDSKWRDNSVSQVESESGSPTTSERIEEIRGAEGLEGIEEGVVECTASVSANCFDKLE